LDRPGSDLEAACGANALIASGHCDARTTPRPTPLEARSGASFSHLSRPAIPRSALVGLAVAVSLAFIVPAATGGQASKPKYCPAKSRVLDGVYHPERLVIMRICRRASGTVRKVILEEDGDLHIRLHLSAGYAGLKNDVNDAKQRRDRVVEFMPRDGGHLPRPAVGDFVTLVGAWVTDTKHGRSSCMAEGWNELHPVWSEIVNGAVSTSGPKNGGSPASALSKNAADTCRDDGQR
jgi:hypothetical protein